MNAMHSHHDDARSAEPASDVFSAGGLDVRLRLLISLVCSAAVLAMDDPKALGLLAAAAAIYLACLRRFKVQLISYLLLGLMSLLSYGFALLLGVFMPMMSGSLLEPFLRLATLASVVLALALSMRLRGMLTVMKALRLPRALYLPLAATVRFIPGMLDDLRQIRDGLRLRGYGLSALLRPRLWLLPVVFRALHLSDELAVATELKSVGYGRPARAPVPRLWRGANIAVGVAALLTLSAAAAFQIAAPERPSRMGHGARHAHSATAAAAADAGTVAEDVADVSPGPVQEEGL